MLNGKMPSLKDKYQIVKVQKKANPSESKVVKKIKSKKVK